MSNSTHSEHPRNLSELLRTVEQTKHERVEGKPSEPRLHLLRDWQVRRLTRTYPDLLSHPRYQPACSFFINDIYAARDFVQRNYDLRRLHGSLRRWIPETMVRPLSLAIELHELTEALDLRLVDVLVHQLGMTELLTAEMYAEAYRRCDNYAVRLRQIELIGEIGNGVESLVNIPLSASVLKLARDPATRSGWGDLMSFLERGYAAFKHMHGAAVFLNTIREREIRILNRIYAKVPDPFGFESARQRQT
jgi:hypothetical protein